MSIIKRKAGSEDIVKSVLEFDEVPTEGSHNLVESGSVAKAIGNLGKPLQWKGPATVAELNAGITGIQPGWTYTLTDAGTLTDGSVNVDIGDEVAWTEDDEWFKVGGDSGKVVQIDTTATGTEIDDIIQAGKIPMLVVSSGSSAGYYNFVEVNAGGYVFGRVVDSGAIATYTYAANEWTYASTYKVISWQGTPDNDHVPSEKLVKDSLDGKAPVNDGLTTHDTTKFYRADGSWAIPAYPRSHVFSGSSDSSTGYGFKIASFTDNPSNTNFLPLSLFISFNHEARSGFCQLLLNVYVRGNTVGGNLAFMGKGNWNYTVKAHIVKTSDYNYDIYVYSYDGSTSYGTQWASMLTTILLEKTSKTSVYNPVAQTSAFSLTAAATFTAT